MKVLAFGAHPDDIEIGMGGSIARMVDKGNEVLMVTVTVPNKKEMRIRELNAAAKVLGANVKILDLEPDSLTFSRKLVGEFDQILKKFNPQIVFTHWDGDTHQDHNFISNSVLAATRKNDCDVFMYEQTIPGGIGIKSFKAQLYIDVTNYMQKKIDSIRTHKSQLKRNGKFWLYGIKGRAEYRGYQINTKYAEAFQVVKQIRK